MKTPVFEDPVKWMRSDRILLLKESDWTQLPDALSDSKRAEWATYRKSLRDIPQNKSPKIEDARLTNITWPTKPEVK